jgi:hypothetical protein
MGSGKRFRVKWDSYPSYAIGVSLTLNSEHKVSIQLNFVKLHVYIGFGKGYDEC